MTAEVNDDVVVRLRVFGRRYTPVRRAIVDTLAGSGAPLTIPGILERAPELAQSSAYRNLAVLEQAGVVQRLVTADDHARYELAEDLTSHHHHLICSTCGDVRDVFMPRRLEHHLDRALSQAAEAQQFRPRYHRLDLVGTCSACR